MKKLTFLLTLLFLNVVTLFGQIGTVLPIRGVTTSNLTNSLYSWGPLVDGNPSTSVTLQYHYICDVTLDLNTICSVESIKIHFGSTIPASLGASSSLDNAAGSYVPLGSLSTASNTLAINTICNITSLTHPYGINQHRYIKLSFYAPDPSVLMGTIVNEIQIIGSAGVNTITYGYDARGSRTSRTITLAPTNKSASLLDTESLLDTTTQTLKEDLLPSPENTFFDAVGESKVTIYPNPTRGELVVKVTNESEEATHRIMLFDSNGAIIYQKENATEYTDVDITDRPSGFYILKIFNGENSTTWKVIKQ